MSDAIFGNWKPLEIIENAFYFTLKAILVLKIFKFSSWHFGQTEKRLDRKYEVNVKVYGITSWLKKNCNTYID